MRIEDLTKFCRNYSITIYTDIIPVEIKDIAIPGREFFLAYYNSSETISIIFDEKHKLEARLQRKKDIGILEQIERDKSFTYLWHIVTTDIDSNNRMIMVVNVVQIKVNRSFSDSGEKNLLYDKRITEILRHNRLVMEPGQIEEYLTNEFVYHNAYYNKKYFFICIEGEQIYRTDSFRIAGKTKDAVITENNRKYLLEKIFSRRTLLQDTAVMAIEADVSFNSETADSSDWNWGLQQGIAESENSFIRIWQEYNLVEGKKLIKNAREKGWVRYTRVEPVDEENNILKFYINEGQDQDENAKNKDWISTAEKDALMIEISEKVPPEILADNLSENIKVLKTENRNLRGVIRRYYFSTVPVEVEIEYEVLKREPPQKGYLYMSMTGAKTMLERREAALKRIMSGMCKIAGLPSIIESGHPLSSRKLDIYNKTFKKIFNSFGDDQPNEMQEKAIKIALDSPDIALVLGPPGTGKTSVINAICNALEEYYRSDNNVDNRRILVSSFQHAAVMNVAERVKVLGLPTLEYGRRKGYETTEDMIRKWQDEQIKKVELAKGTGNNEYNSLEHLREQYVAYNIAGATPDRAIRILKDIHEIGRDFISDITLLEIKNKIQEIKLADSSIHDDTDGINNAIKRLRTNEVSFRDGGSDTVKNLYSSLKKFSILNDNEYLVLHRLSDPGITPERKDFDELNNIKEKILSILDRKAPADLSGARTTDIIEILKKVLCEAEEYFSETSFGINGVQNLFINKLKYDLYGTKGAIERYSNILSTTVQHSVSIQMMNLLDSDGIEEGVTYDTVIIDEAARANPLDLIIPMSLAENKIILVGDYYQLPHMIDDQIIEQMQETNIANIKTTVEKTLFQRLYENLKEYEKEDGLTRTIMLEEQYRMNPNIGDFISDTFYDSKLISSKNNVDIMHKIDAFKDESLIWIDVSGREKRGSKGSYHRMEEVNRIISILLEERSLNIKNSLRDKSIGIITFYSSQLGKIEEAFVREGLAIFDEDGFQFKRDYQLNDKGDQYINIGTVDAFQGREFDIVILSTVRSNDIQISDSSGNWHKKYGFLTPNRINVAMSRAKSLLIVLGDSKMIETDIAQKAVPGLYRFYQYCLDKEKEYATVIQ